MGNGSFLSPSKSSLLFLSLYLIFLLISLFVSLTILFLNLLFTLLLVFTSSILLFFHLLSSHPYFLSFSLFSFAHMFLLFSFFYSYLHLSFSHLFIFTFLFLLLLVIYTYIFSSSFLLTRISSPFIPPSHIFSLSPFYSHLFTFLSCSYICIYLSSLFLVSLIRTYRPPLTPPERHRSRLRFISANERFRDELVLEWEQFRRIRTRQHGKGRRTVKSSAKIAPRDCARHSESPERSQRVEFIRLDRRTIPL